ncbi:MAG: hypothetical protein FD152_4284 [Xanthobacteraceae bacterium]|nr:MAG: hypothetical protein FD152_4284 [Xanthobacteraceae bacterium]
MRAPRSRDDDHRPLCALSGRPIPPGNEVRLSSVRPGLADLIRKDFPALQPTDVIDRAVVADYRGRYVEDLLKAERGEITALERDVVESLRSQEILATNVEDAIDTGRTAGERLADKVAEFGGSWTFIMAFFLLLALWMGANVLTAARAFDPYPFILLNLILSCIAAIQAPIIMMSQKRQEAKDRRRSENDFRVNLKAELEIRHLHEKIDHLLNRQWERLAEIQTLQIELLQDLRASRGPTA